MTYYDQNAELFFSGTVEVDMEPIYQRFIPLLNNGACILDAGCGSGRDTLYFHNEGFSVTAFDLSEQLVELARQYTSLPVQQCAFTRFKSSVQYDGIWACASLLHVPLSELTETMGYLSSFLKPKAVFYCSFKYGEGEVERGGRRFTNLTESSLHNILKGTQLTVKEVWQTGDQRPGRAEERWLNALLIKKG